MFTKNRNYIILRIIFVVAFISGMLGGAPVESVFASTLMVINTNNGGTGSLRQAISDANSGDIITFDSSLSGATIYWWGQSVPTKDIIIDATNLSMPVTLDGQNLTRLFQITTGITVELKNIVLTNGGGYNLGGAINNDGTLKLTKSIISNNRATWGGGIYNTGELVLIDSTFSNNSANQGGGGAIFNQGILTIINSMLSGNQTYYDGGAVHNLGDMIVTNSTFYANHPSAIVSWGTLTVKSSTLSGNGSIGIAVNGNYSTGSNTSELHLVNTILSNSYSKDCYNNGAAVLTIVNSLIELGNCGTPLLSADPNLDSVSDNGGYTQTLALLSGSPAIDAGDSGVCPATDQRGVTRDENCDIGAYEYVGSPPPAITVTEIDFDTPDPSMVDQEVTVQVTVYDIEEPANIPTGVVDVTGADTNCQITLDSSGSGSCSMFFTSAGIKTIIASYDGDAEHLPSSDTEGHSVTLQPTITTIVSVAPSPSFRNADVVVTVAVTGGSTTPIGTVSVSAGANRNCTITLSNGTGNCVINFDQAGSYTITAEYNGDTVHLGSSDSQNHTVLNDAVVPAVFSIVRADPNPTSASSVDFTVSFTEAVTGVTLGDFALTPTGVTGASMTNVSGSGSTYTVTVNTGAGTGTLRLDVVDDNTIIDLAGNLLGGLNIGDGDFTSGELYDVHVPLVIPSTNFYDGWILEASETSSTGGTKNNTATTLRVGDDAANRQYRSILSFDTSTLPEGAVITSVTLQFKYQGKTGTLPFSTHGKLLVDICEGEFKNNPALQLGDFNARCPSGFYKVKALLYSNASVDNWYSQSLLPDDFQFINFSGVTQFRLRFAKDDNNDFGADFLKLHSGNALNEADRPQLVIEYYMP